MPEMVAANPPANFRVIRMGTKYYHERDYVLFRPKGIADYIFIDFLNPAELSFNDQMHIVQPGNCIFFKPWMRYEVKGHDTGLGNDWLHFQGEEVENILACYGLPLNEIIPTVNTSYVREILEKIEGEIRESIIPHRNRLVEILFETLCINISRSVHAETALKLSPSKKEHLESFRKLRIEILENFQRDWTVEDMADNVYVSHSRFAVLYKEFFGVSPIAELLHTRIEHAKWLLTNTTTAINDIAGQCGFKNVYYFSRKFRELVGCPPSRYYTHYVRKVTGEKS